MNAPSNANLTGADDGGRQTYRDADGSTWEACSWREDLRLVVLPALAWTAATVLLMLALGAAW